MMNVIFAPMLILPICLNRYPLLLPFFLTLQNSSTRPTSPPRPAHPEDINILKPSFQNKMQTKLSSPPQRVSLVGSQRLGQRGNTGRQRGKRQTCKNCKINASLTKERASRKYFQSHLFSQAKKFCQRVLSLVG